jgi:hypothetical protein
LHGTSFSVHDQYVETGMVDQGAAYVANQLQSSWAADVPAPPPSAAPSPQTPAATSPLSAAAPLAPPAGPPAPTPHLPATPVTPPGPPVQIGPSPAIGPLA